MVDKLYIRVRGRVQGPFDEDELKNKVRLRTLVKFHEVSVDKKEWTMAETYPELFQTEATTAIAGKLLPHDTVSASSGEPDDVAEWYYHLDGTNRGPVTPENIRELVRSGTLIADDQVWHENLDWMALKDVSELADCLDQIPAIISRDGSGHQPFLQKHSKGLAFVCSLLVVLMLLTVGLIWVTR